MRNFARVGAYVASATLAVTGMTVIAPSAQAVTYNPANANSAADWLSTQLTSGLVHNTQYNFDDYGLTLDFGFALRPFVSHASDVTAIQNAMASHVNDYVTPGGTGTHSYTGGLAKLASFVGHPTDSSFGSQDLITQLEGRVATAAPIKGRIQDLNYTPGDPFDDDAGNAIGQTWAVKALSNAGSATKLADALAFLLKQQCPGGGFRGKFTADKSSPNQSCTSDGQASIDTSSLAVTVLSGVSGTSAALAKAKTWLATVQNCDGSFGYGDDGPNANSTGLAATALGDSVGAREAAQWLSRHQAQSSDAALAPTNVGAIALNDADLGAGKASGIATNAQDRWRRATSQAATGLEYFTTQITPAIHMSSVAGFRKAGARQGFTVTGAEAGTVICLGASRSIAGASGATVVATLPAGTGKRLLTAKDGFGNTAGSYVNVLGVKTLPVTKAKFRNKRSHFADVTVYGLAAGEHASILFRGALKASGTADSAGHFHRKIWTGRKLGKGVVGGYGQFGDIRKGYTTIKVVR